jgi:hypothetical protein
MTENEKRARDILGIPVVDATADSSYGTVLPKTVGQFCSQYEEPFNAQQVSKELAERRGVSQESILAEWEGRRSLGSKVDKEIKTGNATLPEAVAAARWFKSVGGDVQWDVKVNKYGLRGTADAVITKDGKRVVVEVKTSDKDVRSYAKGWDRTLRHPFGDVPASKLASASLQAFCYGLMLEGGPADQVLVLHLNGDKATALLPARDIEDTLLEELEAFQAILAQA